MQAMGVVLLSSLAAGVGVFGPLGARPTALAGISLLAFAVWAIWALLTFEIGARMFPQRARRRTSDSCSARAFAVCALGWALAVGMAFGFGIFYAPALN